MKTYIRIVADTNDADYIETFQEITPEELAIRPHGEQGVHTIVSVEIIEVANVKELFLHKYED